jgi:phosphatidylserine decarboxylase
MAWLWISVAALVIVLVWFKYLYFPRDPERTIPGGNNVVSPADGTVVYVKEIEGGRIPIAVKNGREIEVEELTKLPGLALNRGKLVGVHMSLFNVHINRAPVSGKIEKVFYYEGRNLSMIKIGLRTFLRLKPYYKDSKYLIQNERETSIIRAENGLSICVVRIADRVVKKIISFKKEGDLVAKGERIGLIRMGSQVDILLPVGVEVLVNEGDHVVAGETIIANLREL